MTDDLGDRMKAYEAVEAQRRLDPTLPMLARLDGRSFSSLAIGANRVLRMLSIWRNSSTFSVRATTSKLFIFQVPE